MMELVQGSVIERALRLEIGSGLLLTQTTDGIAHLDFNPAEAITEEYADTHYLALTGGTLSGSLQFTPDQVIFTPVGDLYIRADGYLRLGSNNVNDRVLIGYPTSTVTTVEGTFQINSVEGGANYFYGWGQDVIGSGGVDNYGGNAPYIINYHTGITLTAHDAYGGIRIYAQNYPVLWPAAALVARFMGSGIALNTPVTISSTLFVATPIHGGFGAVSAVSGDWNTVTDSGSDSRLLLDTEAHGPGVNGYYYHPFTFEYSTKDASGNLTQFAIPYASPTAEMYVRGRYSGAWGPWNRFVLTSNYNSFAIADSQLSSNVPLKNTSNTFSVFIGTARGDGFYSMSASNAVDADVLIGTTAIGAADKYAYFWSSTPTSLVFGISQTEYFRIQPTRMSFRSNAGDTHLTMFGVAGSGHFNWDIAKSWTIPNALQFIPSTAADGATFTTPLMSLLHTGVLQTLGFQPLTGSAIAGMWSNGSILVFSGVGAGGFQFNNAANSIGLLEISDVGVVQLSGTDPAIHSGSTVVFSDSASTAYTGAALQIRERSRIGYPTEATYGPKISFHWGGLVASQIGMDSSGRISTFNDPGSAREDFIAKYLWADTGIQFLSGPKLTFSSEFVYNCGTDNTAGGFAFFNLAGTLKGYTYWDVSGNFGLLNDQANWSVRCFSGASFGGQLIGAWSVSTTFFVTGILSTGGEIRAGAYAGAAHSAGDITARRSATTGVYYFGDYTDRYIYYDGTNYNIPTSQLVVASNVVAADFILA